MTIEKMKSNNLILIIILLGLLIRLLAAYLPGFKIDVVDWFAWSSRLNEVGFDKFYSNQFFSDYTPGYMYLLSFLGFLKNSLFLDDKVFYLLLKIPTIIAEMTLAILIARSFGKLTAILILFNPALIFNSSVWGQIDSILALFLYLAIHFLAGKKLMLSSIMMGIAFLIKPQTVAIFPIYLLFLVRNFNLRNLAKLVIPTLVTIFIFSLPFFPYAPFTGLVSLIFKTANQYNYNSLFAYNFWGTIGFWIKDDQIWKILTYQKWGIILLSGYWLILAYLYFKKRLSIYSLATLATLSFYFLPTRVHERYLYPAIVFLILLIPLLKSRLLLSLTILLSLVHFLNLYYVYVYYNEVYFKLPKVLLYPILYNFLDNSGRILSLIATIIFILISVNVIKANEFIKKN